MSIQPLKYNEALDTKTLQYLSSRIAPAEIIGDVGRYPYKEKDGQLHLFKEDWRALVALTPHGPLLLMSWVISYNREEKA